MSEQLVARVGRVAGAHRGRADPFQVRFEAYELDSHFEEAPNDSRCWWLLKRTLVTVSTTPDPRLRVFCKGLCLLADASRDTTLSYSVSLVRECWSEEAIDDGRERG